MFTADLAALCLAPSRREREAKGEAKRLAALPDLDGKRRSLVGLMMMGW